MLLSAVCHGDQACRLPLTENLTKKPDIKDSAALPNAAKSCGFFEDLESGNNQMIDCPEEFGEEIRCVLYARCSREKHMMISCLEW